MENDPKKYPQKAYCYKSECKAVRTGFHLENYPVCKVCRMELTEALYSKLKEKDKTLEDMQLEIDRMFDEHG